MLKIVCLMGMKWGSERQKGTKCQHNSLSVSRWGSPSCRWWQGWRSKPRCTREHFHSGWSCWWTGCRCCLCSHRSYSCPYPCLRCQKPTQRLSPTHDDPGERTVHSDKQKNEKQLTTEPFVHSCLRPPLSRKSYSFLMGIPIIAGQIHFRAHFKKSPLKRSIHHGVQGGHSVN